MANESHSMDCNYSKNLDFKEVETEIKAFKIKQNETFNFYIDSINKLIENVEKAKKNLEEKKKKKDTKNQNIIPNDNITIQNNNTNKNDNSNNNFDIKELIKVVKNLKITEKISEENKKFYNMLLLSYKGIISLIKHETPEIFKNVYIKKNVILRLILLHFLQKGDFFMYYVLNKEILKKKKKKRIEKGVSNIDQSNTNYSTESNNLLNKNNNFLINKNEKNLNDNNIVLNKPNLMSEHISINNIYSFSGKEKKEEMGIKTSINEKVCNDNTNYNNGTFEKKDENNVENKNNVLINYNNFMYNNNEKDKNHSAVSNNNNNYNNGKHSVILNNINTTNININNKETIFSKLKQEYINNIKFDDVEEEINFEHALIEKEIFEGCKKLHTILYDLKNFKVDTCIDWYNKCSEATKKKYSKLIYLLHCINYLSHSKNDKEKALSSLRDLMINFKENKSHISRLSTFICIGVDNIFFKNMFSNVNSNIFNYFKRAFNEEGIIINLPSKVKLKESKQKIDQQKSVHFNEDLIKSTKNSNLYKEKKYYKNEKFLKKKNTLNKNMKNEENDDEVDLKTDNTKARSSNIFIKKKRKNNKNISSSLISLKLEEKRQKKNKKKLKKRTKKNENILKRKIIKGNEKIKQNKKKKKRIDSVYKMCQKEYALNIKISRNKKPLIHNNIYKEKYISVISENFHNNLNKENSFIPLSEQYMENSINRLIEKEKIEKNPFYYDVSNDRYAKNNNLILPKIKINYKNSKNKNKNEEKLNKGWYKYVFNCTKDVFSEIMESQNNMKKLIRRDIKLNKGVNYCNNINYKRTEPIYLYELSENEFDQFYQNDNSYVTYKILNKAAQYYDSNDTKISNNLIQNLNCTHNTNYINVHNSIYNTNVCNNLFINNYTYNNDSCNSCTDSFNYLNNSCFIRRPNMLKRKFPKCKFLNSLCKSQKENEKNIFLNKEVNPNEILLDKKKKSENNDLNKDDSKSSEIKGTNKNEELKEKTAEVEYISSALKKHKKNEDYEHFNFKDINEETNEYSCNSLYSDKSVSSNKSSDSSSENNILNDSSYEENLKKKINKVKEEVDLLKENYLKKNTMTALLSTKNIQANNRAVLAAKNTRLNKTSIDVSRILLTHALTTRDIYTLHNTLTNNRSNAEFRRICLKWKTKKIKRRNRLRKKEKNDESHENEKKKKKKNNSKLNKKKKKKENSKNKNEERDNDYSTDYFKKKKNTKKRKVKSKCANKKKDKFISIVKPSASHSLECFGLEEFIKLTKKNLFVKKSDDKKDENEKKSSSKLKCKNNVMEKKKGDKEKDVNKNIIKTKKEEKTEKDNENKEDNTEKIKSDDKEMYTKEKYKHDYDNKDKGELVEEKKELDKTEEDTGKKDKVKNNKIDAELEEKDKKMNDTYLKEEKDDRKKKDKNEKDEKEKKEEKEIKNENEKEEGEEKNKNGESETDEKDKNEIDIIGTEEESKNKMDKNNKTEINIKDKVEGEKIGENNKNETDSERKSEKDKIKENIEIKCKKEKKGVFYGSYKKNLKKRRHDSNLLLDEKIMDIPIKRNKKEGNDPKLKKNKREDSRTNRRIKSSSAEFYRKNNDSSSSDDYNKKKDKKKINEEKNKDKKKNHENCNKKKKNIYSNKNEEVKEEKRQENLKKKKSENYEEDRKLKKGKEKEKNSKKKKEKKVFIHLESPLSILVCGGLISSKKLIEAQAILKENNKRLQEAKNNSLLNNSNIKNSGKLPTDKVGKGKNDSTKKEDGAFFSNSLAIEVDLSGCFFFHSCFTCPISRDKSSKDNPPYLLTCGHVICKNCVDKIHAQRSRQFKCPMCPQYLHLLEIIPLYFS